MLARAGCSDGRCEESWPCDCWCNHYGRHSPAIPCGNTLLSAFLRQVVVTRVSLACACTSEPSYLGQFKQTCVILELRVEAARHLLGNPATVGAQQQLQLSSTAMNSVCPINLTW